MDSGFSSKPCSPEGIYGNISILTCDFTRYDIMDYTRIYNWDMGYMETGNTTGWWFQICLLRAG